MYFYQILLLNKGYASVTQNGRYLPIEVYSWYDYQCCKGETIHF